MRNLLLSAALSAVIFSACGQAPEDLNTSGEETPMGPTGAANVLTFYVIGDTPYGEEDMEMLGEAVPLIQQSSAPFVIHVGDYKGGRGMCDAAADDAFQVLVGSLAPKPLMYTPGDNEWTDCDRNENPDTGALYSELSRLEQIRETLPYYPDAVYEALEMRRQQSLRENISWKAGNVRFATLHVTGTNNGRHWVVGDPLEAALAAVNARDTANMEWLGSTFDLAANEGADAVVFAMQADMALTEGVIGDEMCTDVATNDDLECDAFMELRQTLAARASQFEKPVLLIHGDTAPFTLNQTLAGDEAPNLWRLNAAGDAGIGRTGMPYGTRDITEVRIDLSSDVPFSAKGALTGKTPKAK